MKRERDARTRRITEHFKLQIANRKLKTPKEKNTFRTEQGLPPERCEVQGVVHGGLRLPVGRDCGIQSY
ncbi:MAG TPA: hypothetical protein VFG29_05195 [Syntrophales bacterium]|nr:hypothetical protein [Syntrophales bacterium]